ncbi:MAG: YggW family oxidoreductase [Coxiella sp. RIFCSPHIGHO2_12_FULL_44_14]|nr:MAG: YggW family oxidoreductase [Coxiella sp. RIFCSPHIGHO2_12_FULL_44_14]
MKNALWNIPLSLYIHFPWCVRKCPYCDFNSHALTGELPERAYINAILTELHSQSAKIHGRQINTIFLGGGTPSLFSADSYQRLLDALKEALVISPNCEITLEANPGTVEQQRFKAYRDLGINRLSVGVQSFQSDKLKALGRIHDAQEAQRAIEIAQAVGFTNINIDIMYGLPKQTISEALWDLQTALNTQPTHLSWYHLTLEPHTSFYRFPPPLPTEDILRKIEMQGKACIKNHGLQHYEVSAYSLPHYRCRHNLNYWEFGDYLGLGAGAHSKWTENETGIIYRHWNIKNPKEYLNTSTFEAGQQQLSFEELPLEFMMNALRLQKPIPLSLFSKRTGLTVEKLTHPLQQAKNQGLLRIQNKHFKVTARGKRYLNDLLALFL